MPQTSWPRLKPTRPETTTDMPTTMDVKHSRNITSIAQNIAFQTQLLARIANALEALVPKATDETGETPTPSKWSERDEPATWG